MYLNYLETDGKKKKPSSLFSRLKIWLLLGILGSSAWYGYTNYPRILFLFKKDRYAPLEAAMSNLRSRLTASDGKNLQKNSDVSAAVTLLEKLTEDHPGDPHLYLLKGRLYSLLLEVQEKQNPNLKIDILYNQYIGQSTSGHGLSAEFWKQGVASYRKSLVLGLPAPEDSLAHEKLLELYFLGGEPYWHSAGAYLDQENASTSHIYQLFGITRKKIRPDWELLKEHYENESVTLLEAIYYLRRDNTPVAFSKLKELALSSSPYLRNNAMFLMGSVMEKVRNHRMKLYYYRQIDLDEFLPRNTWFLTEFYKSLRFAGEKKEAQQLLTDYEKMITELENQRS